MVSGAWQGFCRAVKAFNKLMAYLSAMLIVVCALVLMYEVITRYVISVSNDWVIELCIFMLIAATFMSAAHTQRERAHVGIEILDEVMSARWTRIRMLFGDLLSLGFCVVVAYLSWEFFSRSVGRRLGQWLHLGAEVMDSLSIHGAWHEPVVTSICDSDH